MQKKLLWAFLCFLVMTSGQPALAQVTSVTGDGTLINNSGSTGVVDLTLGNAGAYTVWGNNTSSSAAPGYQTAPQVSGTLTAGAVNVPTGATGYTINSVPIILSGGQLQRGASTTLSYCPYKGNMKTTASQGIYTISSGCLTATITSMYVGGTASQSLSANTLYYIYLWNNSGTWVLDAETTGHATDSTTGIEIESGDNTKTLVGMVYPQTGPVLTDSTTARLVATWDNRTLKYLKNAFSTSPRTTTSTTFVELNSEIRGLFLTWGDGFIAAYSGTGANVTGTDTIYSGITLDGISTFVAYVSSQSAAGSTAGSISISSGYSTSEGEHYITIAARVSASTGDWYTVSGVGLSWLAHI